MTKMRLRGFAPERFFAKYWQRQPGLLRQGLPEAKSIIDADALAGLALHEVIESRLVWQKGTEKAWQVAHGPFSMEQLQTLPESGWSLLVQGVEQHIPAIANLLKAFEFIPRWRLDDVMISVAPPGGSVGPHYDLYDVFLVQISGDRIWQVGKESSGDAELMPGTDLRILRQMPKSHTIKVIPGDVLYIPPGYAHWGVAETLSLTLSVGFRAPLWRAVADQLGAQLFNQFTAEERWFDQGLNYADGPDFELNAEAIRRVLQRFSAQHSLENHVIKAFAETVTGSFHSRKRRRLNLKSSWREGRMWQRDPAVALVCYPFAGGQRAITVNGETLLYPARFHGMVKRLCQYEPVPAHVWGPWTEDLVRRELLLNLWSLGAWTNPKRKI